MSRSSGIQRTVAVIPARGGSKGIPRKNLRRVGGVPLVARAVAAARATMSIDRVYVSTDDSEIAEVARGAGAEVIHRPVELASDTSSSESALTHALEEIERAQGRPDIAVMIQATSPFIVPDDLDEAVRRVRDGAADTAFAGRPSHAFLWRQDGSGAVGVNHDPAVRLRRQDVEPCFQETGAFYVVDVAGYLQRRHRFFGRIEVQPVAEEWSVDVDSFADLDRARAMAPRFAERTGDRFAGARALVMDFDGVHTDDHVLVDETGRESVRVSRSDGHGLGHLRALGWPMLILSKERNPVVAARGRKLQIEVLQGIDDKASALVAWAQAQRLDLSDVVYVGNDVNDIACLELVGWPVAVADAHPHVIPHARVLLGARGGEGALRELTDALVGDTRCGTTMSATHRENP